MIVGLIGPGGEGGTFLDWTLHYLAGDLYIINCVTGRLRNTVTGIVKQEIVTNPIKNDGTAHNHRKTHPTEQLIQRCIDEYNLIDDKEINIRSMYIVPSEESYINGKRSYTKIVSDIANEYTEMKLIHFIFPNQHIEDLVQRIARISKNTESISDIRNRVNAESFKDDKIVNKPNVRSLNIDNMFDNLDSDIHEIFNWLSLSINEERYRNWLTVYRQWQNAQNFCTTIQN
jgi:hypothetical protein